MKPPFPNRASMPEVAGKLTPCVELAPYTWMRVGGPADWLFQPRDETDLAHFLAGLDPTIKVFVLGVGSNLIIRDGGIRGVVIRLGRGFSSIAITEQGVEAGGAALCSRIATHAAREGHDLVFMRTIPGGCGGAVRMNAGCYGAYVADHLIDVSVVTRNGFHKTIGLDELKPQYRGSALPEGWVVTSARFRAAKAEPAELEARMAVQSARRNATQPHGMRCAGSVFRNPSGHSSTGRAGDCHQLKAWHLIDRAGARGARWGGAMISQQHANFMINTGNATASQLEDLGTQVQKRVFNHSGVALEWEIVRVGGPLTC